MLFFPLTWQAEQDTIVCYGWRRTQQHLVPSSLCIHNFHPFVHVKLPTSGVRWNERTVGMLKTHLKKRFKFEDVPIYRSLVFRQGLYSETGKLSPYLYLEFAKEGDRIQAMKELRKVDVIPTLGICVQLLVCEARASGILQMTCERGISTADWFEFEGTESETMRDRYDCSYRSLSRADSYPIPSPVVMSFDIEVYSHNPRNLPTASHPEDKIFQISHVFTRLNSKVRTSVLFTLGKIESIEGVEVVCFEKESDMLLAHAKLVRRRNPQILIGYNIYRFDIPYMLDRAKYYMIYDEFVCQDVTNTQCNLIQTEWSSSAFQSQKTFCLNMKGRLTIDLMPLIQRDHKLPSYSLNTVAHNFLKREKDPLSAEDLFAAYREAVLGQGVCGDPSDRSRAQPVGHRPDGANAKLCAVGEYCVKDSELTLDLFEHLKIWFSLVSLASVCQLPILDLYRYGQQLKVYCQVYRYCHPRHIIVEDKLQTYKGEQCQGAYVLEPDVGLHSNVVSFDFASLYPSIIISHNIDYTTFVPPEETTTAECFVVEWEEHINCPCPCSVADSEKSFVCQKFCFRWRKEPKGILPSIVEQLLAERKAVRKEMANMKPGSNEYDLAQTRQLNLKLSANSVYGSLNAKTSSIMFFPAAMSITAVGRSAINKVKNLMTTKGASTIYGDTDSAYVKFLIFKGWDTERIYNWCTNLALEISKHFPSPMKLEFEGKIYKMFLLLSKKRYMFTTYKNSSIEGKGVLLVRRDNCDYVRNAYSHLLELIFAATSETELYIELVRWCAQILSGYGDLKLFEYTKSVKDIENFSLTENTATKALFGKYVVPKLRGDEKAVQKQMRQKQATTEEEFYTRCLPTHVQLALRMRKRGQPVESGSRMCFVVIRRLKKSEDWMKLEDTEYFGRYYSKRYLDTLFYVDHVLTPIHEIFEVYLGKNCKSTFKDLSHAMKCKYQLLKEYQHVFGVHLK